MTSVVQRTSKIHVSVVDHILGSIPRHEVLILSAEYFLGWSVTLWYGYT